MSQNLGDFTTEQVRAIIRKQGFVSGAMARLIAQETGRSTRNIIAASAALGNYIPKSFETDEQARDRYVPFSEDDHRSGWRLSETSERIIYFALILLVAGLLTRCVIYPSTDGETSSGEVSPAYSRCEADLKPKLNRCLQGPQSTWEACGDAYMRDLKACTSE